MTQICFVQRLLIILFDPFYEVVNVKKSPMKIDGNFNTTPHKQGSSLYLETRDPAWQGGTKSATYNTMQNSYYYMYIIIRVSLSYGNSFNFYPSNSEFKYKCLSTTQYNYFHVFCHVLYVTSHVLKLCLSWSCV